MRTPLEIGRLIVLMLLAIAANACAQKRTVIVLLPDENGSTGRAGVSNGAGAVDLTTPRAATVVAGGKAPAGVTTMTEADVAREFGDVLSALPPPPESFTLHFRFESDELTEESKGLVARILRSVKARPVPEVAVIGHTDTAGSPEANFALGLKRAEAVSQMLVAAGLDKSFIEVTSFGEAHPVARTADETPDARNRRVEISVR
jgi:outer membrane protein OmpA-like peptidoglycan-associated protein